MKNENDRNAIAISDVLTKYKISFFNHHFSRDGQSFIWNTASGALIKVDAKGLSFFERLKGGNLLPEDEPFLKISLKNRMLVLQEKDEIADLLHKNSLRILNEKPKSLSFVIAPGLGCNYSCHYCFESGLLNNTKMSQEALDDTVGFIHSQLGSHPTVKACSVSWFGGEPLLYLDIIEHLSKRLMDCCDALGIKYNAGMISNGRHLTGEAIKCLKRCGVSRVQITIDGTMQKYCLAKGATPDDFRAVVDNIKLAANSLKVTIRINADREDYDDAFSLTKFLLDDCNLNGKIRLYLAFVRQYGSTSDDDKSGQAIFDSAWVRYAKWLAHNFSPKSFGMPLPESARHVNCGLICRGNACIGPAGELYRCEHDFGNQVAVIGNIQEGIRETKWFQDFEQGPPEECAKCQMLPVCFGGCRQDMVHSPFRVNCASFTSRLEDAILLKSRLGKKVLKSPEPEHT